MENGLYELIKRKDIIQGKIGIYNNQPITKNKEVVIKEKPKIHIVKPDVKEEK